MSGASLPKQFVRDSASPADAARYIADLSRGMAEIARGCKLDVLAYLLELVRLEAEEPPRTRTLGDKADSAAQMAFDPSR